ncbi:glucose-repressible alcohol dehydrogenase transcriptional effector [Auricularia subglabra TFB-10046 SS5]|nr:glucose-repressible alcohol dehydrogenase transcriptional effector [Auricularia subglabra TFB-10046 SS5]
MTPHWQNQLVKAETCRASSSAHHRARQSALATRNSTKSAIPITDPSRALKLTAPPGAENGANDGASDSTDGELAVPGSGVQPNSTPGATANGQHPSATVAPIVARPRPTAVVKHTSTWTTLDMGGIRLKNVAPALFSYSFLTTLYLNHNQLTAVPPEISRLRALTVLDLTGNQLVAVPPELGLIASLKELYLFDNHISTLPPEFGSLHQLEMLGVEGNPLDQTLKAIIQKDGTPALIAYLRDSGPVPAPPPERTWRSLVSDAERKLVDADPASETFSVLCYNILCQWYAPSAMYGYTPTWALAWDYRKELILTEIMNYDTDFLCLQEVDQAQYTSYFLHHLQGQDYDGIYWPKSRARSASDVDKGKVDGCAIFYKKNKWRLLDKQLLDFQSMAMQRADFDKSQTMFTRVFAKDNIAVVGAFENIATGTRLIVSNVHIHWNAEFRDVKLVQVALLMDEVDKMAQRVAAMPPQPVEEGQRPRPTYSDGSKVPTIVSGDFNSVHDSGVYEFLANGAVSGDHEDFLGHNYGAYTNSGPRHPFSLKNAYANVPELTMTNYTPGFVGVLDYIWYSGQTIAATSVLGEVDAGYLAKCVGFPNAHFPSDHVCLSAEFRIKPQKDTARNAAQTNGTNGVQSQRTPS